MAARFSFWLDEILWSQGRVAVEVIEELLQDMAGHRSGGPLKAPLHPAPAAGASSSAPAPQLTITPLQINSPQQQQQQLVDDSDGTESSAAAEAAPGPTDAGPPAAELPEEAYLGRATRADEHLLGYCHVQRWHLLWTKSVYGIKAARRMQPGQVVSAIAGLNSLTMKKKMIITLTMVSSRSNTQSHTLTSMHIYTTPK
jgi:tubulin polyglutamylase TTLL6/13